MFQGGKILTLAVTAILTSTMISVPSILVVYASESPYQSGYDHGCDDAGISDPGDRYINQQEKGPSFHTQEFMSGYYDGLESCGGDNSLGSDDGSSTTGDTKNINPDSVQSSRQQCDPSYPDVCIGPPPPDLNCGDISATNFEVIPPDPHGFDGDGDGIGCER
jgi:hypothetical protein